MGNGKQILPVLQCLKEALLLFLVDVVIAVVDDDDDDDDCDVHLCVVSGRRVPSGTSVNDDL